MTDIHHTGDDDWIKSVITKIAEYEGVEPETLPPLYDAVDPEGLDELLSSTSSVQITFLYYEYYVTVHSDGRVLLSPTEHKHAEQRPSNTESENMGQDGVS